MLTLVRPHYLFLVFMFALSMSAKAQSQSADHYYSMRTPYTDARDAGAPSDDLNWGNTPGSPTSTTGYYETGEKDAPTSGAYTDDYGDQGQKAKAAGLHDNVSKNKSSARVVGGRSVGVDSDAVSGSLIKRNKSSLGSGTSQTTTGTDHGKSENDPVEPDLE